MKNSVNRVKVSFSGLASTGLVNGVRLLNLDNL